MNPYQPPATDHPYAWIGSRIRRGFRFAMAAYRQGIRQENLTWFEHIWAWLALAVIFTVCLFEIFGLLTLAYFAIADFQTWGVFFD